ncbi:diiron oxygenase [Dyadobacter sp. CY312]|uniref:diiron oxygenase n=1 Tax=Dyadobacter sp. CY312 TaxID=2907303 RepID=UPI001F46B37D|nr:diiron oxygenase [Dyadobacter sp. CY312]MCE7040214.1 diiron oxygenase [Dyadobacter sp. CY312]
MDSVNFEVHVERMIQLSKDKPLLPETYIPWDDEPNEDTLFMPEKLVSLEGHELWATLTRSQQIELGRLEVVQVMYSYAWSETLACYFFNRHLLKLNPDSIEYRFLIREIIEEFRHQEMFGMAIRKLDRKPILPTRLHHFFGNFTVKWLPSSLVFMSVLSVELMADIYAKHIRKDDKVFSVMRKSSELHHIEEGRHIFYTEAWLKKFTHNAGFFKASSYSIIVMLNVYFMRTLYVQKRFFEQMGVSDPDLYYREANQNYNKKFVEHALGATVEFVKSFNGFNWLTKPLWNWILKVKL